MIPSALIRVASRPLRRIHERILPAAPSFGSLGRGRTRRCLAGAAVGENPTWRSCTWSRRDGTTSRRTRIVLGPPTSCICEGRTKPGPGRVRRPAYAVSGTARARMSACSTGRGSCRLPCERRHDEERAADRMLALERQHRPSASRVVVRLQRIKPTGNPLRHHLRPIPKTVGRTARTHRLRFRRCDQVMRIERRSR